MKAVVICSGGMDSTTAVYLTRSLDYDSIIMLSFDYGQKHNVELQYASKTASELGLLHETLTLPQWSMHTALTDEYHDVPEGHYAEETMKATVVPNRNAIMLNVAVGFAMDIGASEVVAGMHAGDHPIYPDCRPEFVQQLQRLIDIANEGFDPPHIAVPFLDMEKWEIVKEGTRLEVPWRNTWSCYKGGEIHCGRCSTCVERQEAFHMAMVLDLTQYEDRKYWREATGR